MHAKTDLEPAESNTPCKQIQPLSRIKTLNGPRVRRISPVGKEKVYGGKDLPKTGTFLDVLKSYYYFFSVNLHTSML